MWLKTMLTKLDHLPSKETTYMKHHDSSFPHLEIQCPTNIPHFVMLHAFYDSIEKILWVEESKEWKLFVPEKFGLGPVNIGPTSSCKATSSVWGFQIWINFLNWNHQSWQGNKYRSLVDQSLTVLWDCCFCALNPVLFRDLMSSLIVETFECGKTRPCRPNLYQMGNIYMNTTLGLKDIVLSPKCPPLLNL